MSEEEKSKLIQEKPVFCYYSEISGVWKVHVPSGIVIIHDAKHWLEARELEDFYRDMGFNVFRLNTDIIEEEPIAKKLLMSCPRVKRKTRATGSRRIASEV